MKRRAKLRPLRSAWLGRAAALAALTGGWTAACSDVPLRVLDTTIPEDVDLAAVVLVDTEDRYVTASPLTLLGPGRRLEVEFEVGRDATALLLGYRSADLEPWVEPSRVYTRFPLRPRRPGEARLPIPAWLERAGPGRAPVPVEFDAVPDLAADWVTRRCFETDGSSTVLVDADCTVVPCVVDPPALPACEERVELACELDFLGYGFDLTGRWIEARIDDDLGCEPAPASFEGSQRMVCQTPLQTCTLDLFTRRQLLEVEVERLQIYDVQPDLDGRVRPPISGYLSGPVPGPEGTAWYVGHEGRFRTLRCDRSPIPTELVQVGPDPGPSGLAVRSARAGPPCLTLLTAGDGGELFGAFVDDDRRWHWGRFDPTGQLRASVPITGTATASATPTATTRAEDRWLIGLSDQRSQAERAGEGRVRSQLLAVSLDATQVLAGPVQVPDQTEAHRIYGLLLDGSGAVMVLSAENEIRRVVPTTLRPTPLQPRIRTAARLGLESRPHVGLRSTTDPDETLFLTISPTRYRVEPELEPEGVVHLMVDRTPVAGRFFYPQLADPTAAAPWPTNPRKVLVGLVTLDPEAIRRGTSPTEARALLGRFDLDRPGFDPAWVDLGPGQITGLHVGQGPHVWGVLGRNGAVFRVRVN